MRRYADQDLVFGPSGKQGNFFVVLEGKLRSTVLSTLYVLNDIFLYGQDV